jgi:Uma2 family endonuclease
VRAVWVVDPRPRAITVHEAGGPARTFTEADTLTGDDVLPGFRLPLALFFTL